MLELEQEVKVKDDQSNNQETEQSPRLEADELLAKM